MTQNNIANLRINYTRDTLTKADLSPDPFEQFQVWFEQAVSAEILEPNAMTLATSTPDGIPSARIVLLKGIDSGFRFFTNFDSQKGRELRDNRQAALVFYWDILHRQVRVSGRVEKIGVAKSADYFHSRPRGSQIGAWTSPQSHVIADRAELEGYLAQQEAQFADSDIVPLPPFWGGFRLVPQTIEFWQGRPSRLHDRLRYTRIDDTGWQIDRLAP